MSQVFPAHVLRMHLPGVGRRQWSRDGVSKSLARGPMPNLNEGGVFDGLLGAMDTLGGNWGNMGQWNSGER